MATKLSLSHIREHYHWISQAPDRDDYSLRERVRMAVSRAVIETREAEEAKRMHWDEQPVAIRDEETLPW